jgi:3-methyladenine DNA glycosylase AlkC
MVDKKILEHETELFVQRASSTFESEEEKSLLLALDRLMSSIPEKRKSSYGIVSVIAVFCKSINMALNGRTFEVGKLIYSNSTDFRTVSLGLGLISHVGVQEPLKVLPILADASDHKLWEVKEFVQMFVRKITKVHKTIVQEFLLELTQSGNPSYRRFTSESLRPVVENKWIHDEPEFSLKVLRKLFKESEEYPKVSVGNNLSDLSRKNPELILGVVKELKNLNNVNSDFIANRACRNLVKLYPLKVMDLLEVDCYKYKKNKYYRSDFE